MDDQADQVTTRMNGPAHAAGEAAREAAAEQPGRPAPPRFGEPASEPEEDLTEAGYGHGV